MAWNNNPGGGSDDPSTDFAWLINNRVLEMNKAEGNKDWWRYWTLFKFVLQRLSPWMNEEEAKAIEFDYNELKRKIEQIEKETTKADTTKEKEVLDLRKDFADEHIGIIYLLFPRAKLSSVRDEGIIDFDKVSFEQMKHIIRAGKGIPSSIKGAMEVKEGSDGNVVQKEV